MRGAIVAGTVAAPPSSPPRRPLPPGAVDVHSHVFGPFDRFPPLQPSVYPLPDASPGAHAQFRATLGTTHGILTQPAPYGEHPSAMPTATADAEGALRGVAVADASISDHELARWAAAGIVGLRFVEMRAPGGERYPGSLGFEVLEALAPRMAEHGLHAQLWAGIDQYAAALPRLTQLGVPLVLDHLASPITARGAGDPAFRAVVDRLGDADLWIKLTLCRCFDAGPDYAAARPFHDTLVVKDPSRLLWGSDWPYVRLDPAPDAGAMLDLFDDWTDDEAVRDTILVHNPARLYGFVAAKEMTR